MSDALISPAVGGTLWAATAGLTAAAARGVERSGDDSRIPLMGVLGSFVFAAQMVNFAIPGTGSSGHLAGGLLLAILLGPHAAFLVMASVLAVQALFFADGGLLALGCNAFNLGVLSSYVAYPLVWRPIAGPSPGRGRLVVASVAAGIVGLELGALGVVLETTASGISSLPFASFAGAMLSIHLAIGLVEGLATAGVVLVLWRARPELAGGPGRANGSGLRTVVVAVAVAAAVIGGALSLVASDRPDGLEWTVARIAGVESPAAPEGGLHAALARLQGRTAVLPDYDLPRRDAAAGRKGGSAATSLSGLLGAAVVLALALAIGSGLRALRRRNGGS